MGMGMDKVIYLSPLGCQETAQAPSTSEPTSYFPLSTSDE